MKKGRLKLLFQTTFFNGCFKSKYLCRRPHQHFFTSEGKNP
ncbi:hypothetical protein NMH_0036 [Neisseria meningitidis H44/76]|uniref:Type I restriction-modification system, restriction subunit R n=5 Tax=Neisseria meningitidis TaxID=487 RepID=A0A0H5QCJ3_NEIMI|nr:hypothetical protein NMBG2136_0342 [Neisseria meningitidis G2136]AHW74940.1 hypothetical protein NMA510612_0636 [Neisseria meningitidis]EFV64438.1 hypothetical protein NMH_0036 [Neisseria meningitidis H44/76]KER38938.1 hypothetical protein F528_2096 [Neisseria meningitidis 992008]CBA06518.1 hypothetical protein predicted by Glimmer/Critica [Neisseria meningitidis alpha275]CBA07700.1 hypothetical protein predicted by Glimmer/Critica [Neisseria meningitidis alpha153]CRY99206.1 Type I restric